MTFIKFWYFKLVYLNVFCLTKFIDELQIIFCVDIQDEKFIEKDELVNLILASNSKFEKLIADIGSNVEKFILLKFQQIVKDMFKDPSWTYEQTINKIDQVLQTVGDYQANKTESEQVKYIEIDRVLQKNEPFKFTIDQVIASRPDQQFIEFIPSKDVQPMIYSKNVKNGLIDISENSISGTAPSKNGEYNYDVFIKVVFVIDKSDTTIHIPFIIFVGNKNLQNSKIVTPEYYFEEQSYNQNLVRLLIFIASVLVILLCKIIISRLSIKQLFTESKNINFSKQVGEFWFNPAENTPEDSKI